MQLHRALKIFAAHVLKWTNFHDAGVIDQDVDPAEAINGSPDGRVNLSTIEQIAFDRENFTTASAEIGFCTHEFLTVARNQSHIAASLANMSCEHESESARTTGDEDNFVTQSVTSRAKDSSSNPGT
jgi:hypothetical protein